MADDVFGYKRAAVPGPGWDPQTARDFRIVLRDVTGISGMSFKSPVLEFRDAALQFWDGYVAVVLRSGEVHAFPYVTLADIVVLAQLDMSPEARGAAVAKYKSMAGTAGGEDHGELDVSTTAGAPES